MQCTHDATIVLPLGTVADGTSHAGVRVSVGLRSRLRCASAAALTGSVDRTEKGQVQRRHPALAGMLRATSCTALRCSFLGAIAIAMPAEFANARVPTKGRALTVWGVLWLLCRGCGGRREHSLRHWRRGNTGRRRVHVARGVRRRAPRHATHAVGAQGRDQASGAMPVVPTVMVRLLRQGWRQMHGGHTGCVAREQRRRRARPGRVHACLHAARAAVPAASSSSSSRGPKQSWSTDRRGCG